MPASTIVDTFLAEDPLGDELKFYLRAVPGSNNHQFSRWKKMVL